MKLNWKKLSIAGIAVFVLLTAATFALSQDPQGPPPAKKVHGSHDRASGRRTTNRMTGCWSGWRHTSSWVVSDLEMLACPSRISIYEMRG